MSQVEIDWLVHPPEGLTFTAALNSACRGSSTIATVMNFFLYEAACQVKRAGIDKSTVDYVQLQDYTLDDIINGIKRLNRTACKTTLIAYISKLKSWEFIQSDGYRHTYDVHFNKVQEAFNNPPEPEQPKVRGRHAHRKQEEVQEDFNFNHQVKTEISKIHAQNEDTEILILTEEISNLKSEISDLSGEISNLKSEISNLKSLQSSEAASREALEDKVDALYKVIYKISNSNIKIEESKRENAPTRPRKKSSVSNEVQKESPDLTSLSEDDHKIYDSLTKSHKVWYLKLNGNGRHNYATWMQKLKKPTYIALGEKTVETLNAYPPLTLDELLDLEKFAYKIDGEYLRKHGGFQIHNVLVFLPKWQAELEREHSSKAKTSTPQPSQEATPDDEQKLVAWTRTGQWDGNPLENWQQFELMTKKEARLLGWTSDALPGVIHNKIMIQLRKQADQLQRQQVSA